MIYLVLYSIPLGSLLGSLLGFLLGSLLVCIVKTVEMVENGFKQLKTVLNS